MARITGVKAHRDRLARLTDGNGVDLVGRALFAGANAIATEAGLSITNGSVSGKFHVPSKPYEPPNNDTGVLNRSISAERTGPLEARVVADAPYAVELEFGTSKMIERPYLRPATRKTRPEIVALVRRAVSKALGL